MKAATPVGLTQIKQKQNHHCRGAGVGDFSEGHEFVSPIAGYIIQDPGWSDPGEVPEPLVLVLKRTHRMALGRHSPHLFTEGR